MLVQDLTFRRLLLQSLAEQEQEQRTPWLRLQARGEFLRQKWLRHSYVVADAVGVAIKGKLSIVIPSESSYDGCPKSVCGQDTVTLFPAEVPCNHVFVPVDVPV